VKTLAAAYPRASWTKASDAAYTMALVDAGLDGAEVAVAVRWAIQHLDELPTVAKLIAVSREQAAEAMRASWRCPRCGENDKICVWGGRVVDCGGCGYEAWESRPAVTESCGKVDP